MGYSHYKKRWDGEEAGDNTDNEVEGDKASESSEDENQGEEDEDEDEEREEGEQEDVKDEGSDVSGGLDISDDNGSDSNAVQSSPTDDNKLARGADSDDDMYTDEEPLRYAWFTTCTSDSQADKHHSKKR